jgi:hypothetical protein
MAPALLLAGVALVTLWLQLREVDQAPSDAEWNQARDIIRAEWGDNDVIRVAPNWADGARVGLYDYTFNIASEAEDEELYRYDRLWLLADREHYPEALASLPEHYEVVEEWQPNSRVRLALVDISAPERVLFDVVDHVDQAVVTKDFGDRQEPCDNWRNESWYCGPVNHWLYVRSTVDEMDGSLRRCVYATPMPDAALRISWDDVEMGREIAGNVGTTMTAIRAERGSPVEFRIEIDGQQVHRMFVGKWDPTFLPFRVDTAERAGEHHRLSFVIWATEFWDRWLCFRARVLR